MQIDLYKRKRLSAAELAARFKYYTAHNSRLRLAERVMEEPRPTKNYSPDPVDNRSVDG